jgi:hypothetical protein
MNFAVVFGASLWSGYALPACHPEKGIPDGNRQRFHLAKAETCPHEAGHLYHLLRRGPKGRGMIAVRRTLSASPVGGITG